MSFVQEFYHKPSIHESHQAKLKMKSQAILSLALAILSLGHSVTGTPVRCSDASVPSRHLSCCTWLTQIQVQRDMVLAGEASPETCCSYGTCKGDVNVSGG